MAQSPGDSNGPLWEIIKNGAATRRNPISGTTNINCIWVHKELSQTWKWAAINMRTAYYFPAPVPYPSPSPIPSP